MEILTGRVVASKEDNWLEKFIRKLSQILEISKSYLDMYFNIYVILKEETIKIYVLEIKNV